MSLAGVDLGATVGDQDAYEKEVKALQERVFRLQIDTYLAGRKAVLVFEGWDASGKGGAIRRLTSLMDPRGYKVWPIAAPSEEERRHHYLWRFWRKTPGTGELCIFDRSWYGRVLVERVEGFARPAEWRRAYDEINAFERMLTDDGVRMAKFFIHIDKKTQLQRFRAREKDPLKQYKLGPEDWRNRERWRKYEGAIQEMLDRTHRPDAPWHVVPGNDKRYSRLEVLRRCAELLA
ncbi:polyphosphate kinase 2 family protein [Pyxidicoccus xibeiensis]|uniref:polyphosphate kinase 2 family protein n=1 Tax=Pyxidicoccus xibeiensis TaxID=2906759 RepID=UPI0020A762AC|nr:polyphosphate kinase [Pyxidicoccus xibeiensis]MCP3141200.1 polyphosphate kinase [Pyxidicoccus xibeiensis]